MVRQRVEDVDLPRQCGHGSFVMVEVFDALRYGCIFLFDLICGSIASERGHARFLQGRVLGKFIFQAHCRHRNVGLGRLMDLCHPRRPSRGSVTVLFLVGGVGCRHDNEFIVDGSCHGQVYACGPPLLFKFQNFKFHK